MSLLTPLMCTAGVSVLHPELKERGEEVDHVRIGLSSLYEQW